MSEEAPQKGNLVAYKNHPARVLQSGAKLEIELDSGEHLKVRPKDVILLHPGPLTRTPEFHSQPGEVEAAWELLGDSHVRFQELAELVYGDFTPASAWSTWELLQDGLYFTGSLQSIRALPAGEVEQLKRARETKQAEAKAWSEFIADLKRGKISTQGRNYLREVEQLAYAQREDSRILRELGKAETPENAHAVLLDLGFWDETANPHPKRLGIALHPPIADLPEFPTQDRLDLTHLTSLAIDDEGNRDPDDAISIQGGRVWVHIADVAALVPPDSPADIEARERAANLYLPEGTVPMLPERAVSLLGLGLQEISPALSFGIELSDDGEIDQVEIAPSWVRVQRLSYEEAEKNLDQEPLSSLAVQASAYYARRLKNGATEIDLPEAKIRLLDGEIQIRPLAQLKSRELVREAMLMAGEAAARFATLKGIPFPFVIQDPHDASILPQGMAGMYALRRSMKRSQVSSYPGLHAGLGLPAYSRATSPLRRYLDLVVHQQLRAYLTGEILLGEQELLNRVGISEAVIAALNRAEQLSNLHWTLVYLRRHPGYQGTGVLVDLRGKWGHFILPSLALETQVYMRQALELNAARELTLQSVHLPTLEAQFTF